jgi:hypothetical protein
MSLWIREITVAKKLSADLSLWLCLVLSGKTLIDLTSQRKFLLYLKNGVLNIS